jgi:LL-diaminopimelate aminotransferase
VRIDILSIINTNFVKLPGSYLFAEVAARKARYLAAHPEAQLINMGIGDVTRPLAPSVIKAMHGAVDEMSEAETFKGYSPDQGYPFLRELIAENDYKARGADISPDEIFISDGAKSDCANIGDIFSPDCTVAVCDPVYPVYVDSNAMTGRAGTYVDGKWDRLVYLPCTMENSFVPELPKKKPDMIYLCYPNNPTGGVITFEQLKKWVDYANETGAVILYDAAYEAFISSPGIPHTIFEIPGAETCSLEFRSFSKTAGFTGTRCAYTVISKKLVRDGQSLHFLWGRRQSTKFNGVPYVIQRGAAAIYTPQGKEETAEIIAYYKNNAKNMRDILKAAGLDCCGGTDSPYVWLSLPKGMDSWKTFDLLLTRENVVTTPGAGFGACGEGYIRLTAFGNPENTIIATNKIAKALS